jgi:ATP synthase protein I
MRYTLPPLQGARTFSAMFRALRRPIRTVLMWQFFATAAIAAAAALLADITAALSAAAGGAVSIIAGAASALVAFARRPKSAGRVLAGALRAEAVKLALALVLLWLVLVNYPQTTVGVFLGTFVVTMLIFSMAFFVREY